MYNTLEMGCDDSNNVVHSHSEGRVAMTTHCDIAGYLFHEAKVGHGKMFLKSSHVKYLDTPHR